MQALLITHPAQTRLALAMPVAFKLLAFHASNDAGTSEPAGQGRSGNGSLRPRRISLFDLIPPELLARSTAIREWGINE